MTKKRESTMDEPVDDAQASGARRTTPFEIGFFLASSWTSLVFSFFFYIFGGILIRTCLAGGSVLLQNDPICPAPFFQVPRVGFLVFGGHTFLLGFSCNRPVNVPATAFYINIICVFV